MNRQIPEKADSDESTKKVNKLLVLGVKRQPDKPAITDILILDSVEKKATPKSNIKRINFRLGLQKER